MTKRLNYFRGQRGFSLLELVIVLFMMGLIAGLTTPFLASTLNRAKSESQARALAATLRYVRDQAVSQKTTYAFNANLDEHKYWISNIAAKTQSTPVALGPEIRFAEFFDPSQVTRNGEVAVYFFPQGNSSVGTFELQSVTASERDKKIIYDIHIDPVTGRTTITQPAG